jgi:hypothetical protein
MNSLKLEEFNQNQFIKNSNLIDGVFEQLYYEFVPRIVAYTWKDFIKYTTTRHYNESRIKYHHHPKSIYDIDLEEYNFYKANWDIIDNQMKSAIKINKNKNPEIYNSLIKSYKLMKKEFINKIKSLNIRSGHIFSVYKK